MKTLSTITATFMSLIVGCGSSGSQGNHPGNPPGSQPNLGQLQGPNPVNLLSAGDFVILAKSAITTVPGSVITGDVGISPAAASDMEGFSLVADASNEFSTSTQVVGKIYASDYAPPTPSKLTTAISDMEAAYSDAVGRSNPTATELGSGDISGMTLTPGLYKWGTGLLINTDVTLHGGPNDVFIMQVAGGITQAANVRITMSGGLQPKNVFWAVADVVSIGTGAHFEGVILAQTSIALDTGATINGRLLAQTAVTLDQSTVTQPAQ